MTDKERADELSVLLQNVSFDLDAAYEMFCILLDTEWVETNYELREALLTVVCRFLQRAKSKVDCFVNPESEVIKLVEKDLSDMRALIKKFHFTEKTVS